MRRRRKTQSVADLVLNSFFTTRSDYASMRESRFEKQLAGVNSSGSGANYHIAQQNAYFRLMEKARSHDRNDIVVGQGVNRLVDNVVRNGFNLDVQTGNDELDKRLSDLWNKWSATPAFCHLNKRCTFSKMEKLTLRHVVVDGDILHLPLDTGQLETVEAHRLRTATNTSRNVICGVVVDDDGTSVEYWVAPNDVHPLRQIKRVSDVEKYSAFDSEGNPEVFHIFDARRFSQTRGVTALAPINSIVGMHDDIQFSQMVKQQMSSAMGIIRELKGGIVKPPTSAQLGEQTKETRNDGSTRIIEEFSPGLYIEGMEGEEFKVFSGNIPNQEFFPHSLLLLTFIAINLNLPVAVLLLDPSKTNFSGWRGAIDQARMGFQSLQQMMIEQFHTPVYRWKVRQWMAEDREIRELAKAGDVVDVFGHSWNPPSWEYIEPNKDAQSDTTILSNGLNSPRRVFARRGLDWDKVSDEIVNDRGDFIEKAILKARYLNGKYEEAGVDWRDLAPLGSPFPITQPIIENENVNNEDKNGNADAA